MSATTTPHETAPGPAATGLPLLAQADLFLALARAFAPPSEDGLRALEEVAPLGQELAAAAGVTDPAELAQDLAAAAAAARRDGVAAWQGEHERLFACNVLCPIHETGYIRRDKGHVLADLAGFYRAFGVALRGEAAERQDHLVAELEFAAALLVLLARAEAEGRGEDALVTRDALRAFCDDHLGEWVLGFARRLEDTCRLEVHARLARALAHAWASFARAHGYDDAPGRRLPVVEDDPGTPYECDMGGGPCEEELA